MATVKLSSLKLSMTTVTGSKKQVVLCTGTAIRYKRGEDRQTTDTIEACSHEGSNSRSHH